MSVGTGHGFRVVGELEPEALAGGSLANAVAAVKAVRRGRDAETVRGLVERGGARVGVREVASGRWADDIARLVDAAERADPRAREPAGRVRELVTAERAESHWCHVVTPPRVPRLYPRDRRCRRPLRPS